jgi:PBSX family phage terminase large subunit
VSGAVVRRESVYQPFGAIRDLWTSTDTELLISGPAHTGKSVGCGNYILFLCEMWPGLRVLIVRKTRASISESFIPTFENRVLPAGHPMGAKKLAPTSRHGYDHPETGARIVLGSMENPTRLFSTEWDIIWYEECTEATLNEWESLFRALRNKKITHPHGPHPETGEPRFMHRIIGTCNPDSPHHWLMTRVKQGKLRYVKSEHKDNPSFTRDDREKLERMTGVRRDRLLLGLWKASEGAIWDNFDLPTHRVADHPRTTDGKLAYAWTVAAVDWGYIDSGAITVWGVDHDGRMYRAWEVKRELWSIDQWVERAVQLDKQWKPVAFVCDNARGEHIAQFKKAGLNAIPVSKTGDGNRGFVHLTLDLVRDRLKVQPDGFPRLMFVADAHDDPQGSLVEKSTPTCTEDEIPGYSLKRVQSTGEILDGVPADSQEDHCIDTLRYATWYVERYHQTGARGDSPPPRNPELPARMSDFMPPANELRAHLDDEEED